MNSGAVRKLLALLACAGFSHGACAHPVLELVQQTVSQPAQGTKATPTSKEFPVRLTLGGNYAAVESQGTRRIYDFEHRRLYDLQLDKKTYQESSLYSVLGFNTLELQNRLRINAMLDAAKIQKGAQAPAMLEHLFSLSIDGQNTTIDKARERDVTLYRWNGKALLSTRDKPRPLPAGSEPQYWRWLRYTIGGHPKIYADLQKRTAVPEVVRMVKPALTEEVVTVRITRVTSEPDAPYSLDGFTRAAPAREPFVALKQVGSDASAALAAQAEAAKKERDAATTRGKVLDAALAHFAYALATGDSGVEWLTQMRDRVNADADSRAFMAALRAKNAKEAAEAVKTLNDLRARSTSPDAYLLDVFAANHELAQKHGPEAERRFLLALSSNPYLAGAWFDLGKLYYSMFRTQEAWACWDAARRMNPNHPFAKEIDTLERELVTDHPEFF